MQFQLDEALEVLADTPRVLDALLRNKSASWLNCRKTPDAFSPVDVLGHLILADRTDWIPRLETILEFQDSRPFEPFDRFAFQPIIRGKAIGELLDEFAGLRKETLQMLRTLCSDPSSLDLPGLHPELGSVTLRALLATWTVHDLGHISQIVKTMANEYKEDVGPWRAYLSILD